MSVVCALCGGPAVNDYDWPICEECWDTGRYERWLLVQPWSREIARALAIVRGSTLNHPVVEPTAARV